MQSRRRFLASAAGTLAACGSGASGRSGKPNFLFVLTDDQRHDAVGCAGLRPVRTPSIDSVAARGVRFTQAAVVTSICSPSRAACLTGQYGSRNGVLTVPGRLSSVQKTLAQAMKESGYRTGYAGKWHLETPATPTDAGFDFDSHFAGNGPHYDREVLEQGETKVCDGSLEDWNADRAELFLTQSVDDGRPFFFQLSTQLPHMDDQFAWPAYPETKASYDASSMPLPSTWNDALEGKPPYLRAARSRTQALRYGYDDPAAIRTHVRDYYASVTDMDRAFGRVLAALNVLGLTENTYIVILGDNGWLLGEHGLTSKVLAYEESMRVPLIVAGPGVESGVRDQLAANIDIAPTILSLAGAAPLPDVQGVDLTPVLDDPSAPLRDSLYYEAPKPSLGAKPIAALRSAEWKYIRTYAAEGSDAVEFEELYHLKADPQETTNLASSPDGVDALERFRTALDAQRSALT